MARHSFTTRMHRPSLLAATLSLALVSLTPSAFSAAVVHNGSLIGRDTSSMRSVSQRALERLHSARGDFAAPGISLASQALGDRHTLSGAVEVVGPTLALPDQLSAIAGGEVPSSAPVAAANGVGSASAFGAIPEPSSLALLALGAGSLLRRRRS